MIKIDKVKFTKTIKNIVKKLDDKISYYTNVDISWYDRYSDNSYIYLLKNGPKIIGYLYGTFITKKLYNSFINGEIISDSLIDINEFVENSDYIYLASIVIEEKYRNNHYGSFLLNTFLKDNLNKKIVMLTISEKGYNLVNKYFELHKQIDKIHSIFIKNNITA